MEDIADPDLACRGGVGRAEDPLGNTTTNKDSIPSTRKPIKTWQDQFNFLSPELHMNIMAQMHRDPISQICLSLVSQHWHRIFHTVVNLPLAGQKSRYRAIAPDLRCQISADEKEMLYGSREYWYLLGAYGVEWNRPLVGLLRNEKWLWKGTKLCEGCVKYKPGSAYREFYWERQMLRKHAYVMKSPSASNIQHYRSHCRRCRARVILLILEERHEYLDPSTSPEDERTSLGLKDEESPITRLCWDERREALKGMVSKGEEIAVGVGVSTGVQRGWSGEVYEARRWGYVLWSEVWEDLGI